MAKSKTRKKGIIREYTEIIVMAVALAFFVRTFFVQAFRIPSESMEDTLLVGDFLFANKFLYGAKLPFTDSRLPGIRDPRPGDIIIFKAPHDGNKDYIKRCIAIEGQTVELKGNDLYVDGEKRDEPFVKYVLGDRPQRQFGPVTVPDGTVWMMGDNRDNSADSRAWGPLDKKYITGKAMFIYFSWNPTKHSIRFSRVGNIIR